MKTAHRFSISTAALLVGLGTMPALAQESSNVTLAGGANTTANDTVPNSGVNAVVQNDESAETNIEQGLKSGQLSADEAARLQAHQARIDQLESRDLRNGELSANEETKIDNAENKEDNRITTLENNGVMADPTSTDSTRMANDVQRNANQENRIVQGVNNGSLTNTEVGTLENGQARAHRTEARLGSDGTVSNSDQNRIRMVENFQSDDIRNDRHNGNNVTTNSNVTTQGTLNGSAVPENTTTNINTAATVPNTQMFSTGNVQASTTPSVTGSNAAVQAAPATVMNGTAVHAPVASMATHVGHH